MMCNVLNVSRSGWYASHSRMRPTAKDNRDDELLTRIRETHSSSREAYGSPRVHAQLLRDGVDIGRDRVSRLMKVAGLRGRVRRRFKKTTDSKHKRRIADNELHREFDVEMPDSVWCADITYIPTASGFVHLAAIIDLATRMIVGWSMATHMRTELIESAFMNALSWRTPAEHLEHHSDRGSQYASKSYQQLLSRHQVRCSMSRAGDCWDNAVIESFSGTYKQEWANHQRWTGLVDSRAATHDYIEVFYNRERLHSPLDYRTPAEVDEAMA
ncbi:MAG: putative transposase [Planctomycetota bacterium]|jgi:putative transposase